MRGRRFNLISFRASGRPAMPPISCALSGTLLVVKLRADFPVDSCNENLPGNANYQNYGCCVRAEASADRPGWGNLGLSQADIEIPSIVSDCYYR
jgi:hypothetical protein